MLADALSVGHHSGCSETLGISGIQGYDNQGLVLLCVYVFSILLICIDILEVL
jgi:hypothetical protein